MDMKHALILAAFLLAGCSALDVASMAIEEKIVSPPSEEPASSFSPSGVECIQQPSCEFYNDVLLVVKLNPVRLLWIDALINFYGTGFKNIVFFSSLRKDDTSHDKYILLGSRQVKVHLLDDNYGFCDHYTVAVAMQRWPAFTGYIYLSDDVYFPYWTSVGLDKQKIWRQKTTKPNLEFGSREMAALKEIQKAIPSARLNPNKPPFAATSGLYYVPVAVKDAFITASTILLKHRTYNEWGTPMLLTAVSSMDPLWLRGKLVWEQKRILVKKIVERPYAWYHPIRAVGEFFTRMIHFVHKHPNLKSGTLVDATRLFNSTCLDCATYPKKQRLSKGLYHSCVVHTASNPCGNLPLEQYAKQHWPAFPVTNRIGGRVVVDPSRAEIPNPLELRHEGFWNKEVTDYVFNDLYPKMNRTHVTGRVLSPYPACCTTP